MTIEVETEIQALCKKPWDHTRDWEKLSDLRAAERDAHKIYIGIVHFKA